MSKIDLIDEITKLYQKFLKRDPDKTGLFYFISQIESMKMTIKQVEHILLESDEGKAIQNFSHYSDHYWNELDEVKKYKNLLSTDNENTHWIDDIKNRFSNYLPFNDILIVGCGNGWLERKLSDMKIGLNFDAFDISEKYIQNAKDEKGNRNIHYFIDDINDLQLDTNKKYDAIFNFAILHHATEIDNAMKQLSKALKSHGLIFNEEYVGPVRNQYSDKHVLKMLEVLADMPERFRPLHSLKPALANFRVEPSEAIHSDLVIPTFKKYFDVVYERNMNGGIAYPILWNNLSNFENNKDPDSRKWLNYILEKDLEITKEGKVPVLFWYGVGKPKGQ